MNLVALWLIFFQFSEKNPFEHGFLKKTNRAENPEESYVLGFLSKPVLDTNSFSW